MIDVEKIKNLSGKHLLFISLFIIFAVFVPFYYLSLHLGVDEATFLLIGDFIRNGSLLYRDIADIKPPGIYYLAALIFSVAGKSFMAPRILTYIINIASAILVFFIGKKIKNKNVGMTSSIIFLISVYSPLLLGYRYRPEPYVIFFSLLAVLFFLKYDDSRSKFVVGLMLGMGILFKQTAILLFGAFLLYYLLLLRVKKNRTKQYVIKSAKNLIMIFSGLLTPFVIVFLYFLMVGTADKMLYCTIFFFSNYHHGAVIARMISGFFSYLPIFILTFSIVLFVGYRFLRGKTFDEKHLFLILWILLLSIPTLTFFIFSHRTIFIFPPLSILAGLLLVDLYQNLKNKQISDQLKCFIVITFLITSGIAIGTNLTLLPTGNIDDQIRSVQEVEQYVEGRIYVFPYHNDLFFFTNLTPGVSYLGDVNSFDITNMVISDLQNNNVIYIAATKKRVNELVIKSKEGQITTELEPSYEIYVYIGDHYEMLTTTEHYIIYKLKEDSS